MHEDGPSLLKAFSDILNQVDRVFAIFVCYPVGSLVGIMSPRLRKSRDGASEYSRCRQRECGNMHISRREFVKSATAGGITLSLSRLAMAEQPGFAARETLPGRQRWNPAATGMGRIDGVPKVTGSKLYAADFRAADLPGWPAKTSHAMVIRAHDATHVYAGLDLSRLTGALKPAVVVTADDLARIGARVPEFYAGDLLCPIGTTPLYLGQPIALLVFESLMPSIGLASRCAAERP